MALDQNFLSTAESVFNPKMGTERMAPLLHSLIRFNRPRRILEIGAGYTTPFMAQALRDTFEDWQQEQRQPVNTDLVPEFYTEDYAPKLLCIDDHSFPDSNSSKVRSVISELELGNFVDFVDADFMDYWNKIDKSYLPFDMIWFDCGGMKEYFFCFNNYWQFVNPNGGLLLMHSTLTNLEINTLVKSIKLTQAQKHQAYSGDDGIR
jgi:predicted O-methyltransferase YrrM